MKKRAIFVFLVAVLLSGCGEVHRVSTEPAETVPETQAAAAIEIPAEIPAETPTAESENTAAQLLAGMDLRQKVGQLFFVIPDSLLDGTPVTECTDAMVQALQEYPVGGLVMFADNIVSREQITRLNEDLQQASSIPLLLSADEEGGTVARLSGNHAMALPRQPRAGSVRTEQEAYERGSTVGAYMKKFGFNMNFAPVADVNTNPANPVIGSRSFSSDPERAAILSEAMARGLKDQGILPVYKHFPGHGDTAQDSHTSLALSGKTEEEMLACEWIPFASARDCIMVGHIAAPEITGTDLPATLSSQIVTDILKDRLGFGGLVITDSLEMGAITQRYSPLEASLGALRAGCHMLLQPQDVKGTFDLCTAAVENGEFSPEALDAIVLRILEFKLSRGIIPQ